MSNRMMSVLRQMGPKLLFRGAVLIMVLVGAGFLANHYKFEDILDYLDFSADELAEIDRHAKDADINLWAASAERAGPSRN